VTNKAASGEIKAELLPDLPTNPKNLENAIQIDTAFWLENLDRLTERFNKWAAK
jgi:putative spermidine/putrescine transport system substrate-binding protein